MVPQRFLKDKTLSSEDNEPNEEQAPEIHEHSYGPITNEAYRALWGVLDITKQESYVANKLVQRAGSQHILSKCTCGAILAVNLTTSRIN